MEGLKKVSTQNAPNAIGPYEQAVCGGGFIFTSGQIAIDPAANRLTAGGIEAQTRRVMENLKAVLEAGGSAMERVVSATIYLTDLNDFDSVNGIYGEYFKESRPARSTVRVSGLPKGALVEIAMIALS